MILNREKLYQEIWKMSVKGVAEKYHLNYQKLLKACREKDIPIPDSKYWVTLRTGQDVSNLVVPLSESDCQEIEVPLISDQNISSDKKDSSKEKKGVKEIEKDLEEKKAVGQSRDNRPFTDSDAQLIKEKLSFLSTEKVKKIVTSLSGYEVRDNKRLHKKVSAFKKQVALWDKKVRNAQRDFYDLRYERNDMERPKFIKDVSKENRDRLFRILDMIVETFEAIGERVTDDFCILITKDVVPFEIIESTTQVKHELTKEEAKQLLEYEDSQKYGGYASKPTIKKYDYPFNGKFRIKMSNGKYLKDKQDKPLEKMLPDIIVMFYESYHDIKIQREEREERQRQWEEEQRRKEEYADRVKAEKEKTMQLLNVIEDYRLAADIRNFADVLSGNESTDDELLNWIREKANWIDPLISKEDELLGKREHYKDAETKLNFLQGNRSSYRSLW